MLISEKAVRALEQLAFSMKELSSGMSEANQAMASFVLITAKLDSERHGDSRGTARP